MWYNNIKIINIDFKGRDEMITTIFTFALLAIIFSFVFKILFGVLKVLFKALGGLLLLPFMIVGGLIALPFIIFGLGIALVVKLIPVAIVGGAIYLIYNAVTNQNKYWYN